jgi:transposase
VPETETSEAELEDRVASLEDGQSKIMNKLDELIGGVHTKAAEHQETRLGRPSSVEDQVRAELDRKDREAKAAAEKEAEKEAEKSERQTMREMLAKLTEAPPVQPQPRRQRAMWGPR